MKIGFLCPEIPGHFIPIGNLAKAMRDKGHECKFLFCGKNSSAKLEFYERLKMMSGKEANDLARNFLICQGALAKKVLSPVIGEMGFDCLVGDECSFETASLAEAADVPFVTASVAAAFFFTDLIEDGHFFCSENLHLSQNVKCFDVNAKDNSDVCYVGPFHRFGEERKEDFFVYVTLGTIATGHRHIYQLISRVLSARGFRAVISVGGQHSEDFESNKKIKVVSFCDQDEAICKASLVICQGGLNTILAACSYGVPLIIIPFAYDQHRNALGISKYGNGVVLDHRFLSEEVLSDAICKVIDSDETISEKVKSARQAVRSCDGLETASRLIEKVVTK